MRIAVLINGVMFDSQRQTVKGIIDSIREKKDRCYIFCTYGVVNAKGHGNEGIYEIFKLPDLSTFDGVIYVKNTIYNERVTRTIEAQIRNTKIPCVVLNSYKEDCVNISLDNTAGMDKIMDHLINVHDCKNIYFVAGPENNKDSNERYNSYHDKMIQNGFGFDEKHVFYGDYKLESGKKAVDKFGIKQGTEYPDAIVCANDNMAIGVCFELENRGIKVPDDIKVTGFDHSKEASINYPQITTISRPQYEMGQKAVDMLHEYDKYVPGSNIVMETTLICSESCGCPQSEPIDEKRVRREFVQGAIEWGDISGSTKRIVANMTGVQSFDELLESLESIVKGSSIEQFFLCNCEGSMEKPLLSSDYSFTIKNARDIYGEKKYTDKMIPTLGMYKGTTLMIGENGTPFPRKEIVPPQAKEKDGDFAFCIPVYYVEKCLGYAVVFNSLQPIENDLLFTWCSAISNAQENINKHIGVQRLADLLDRMWVYDTLTGLYNRAGFFKMVESMVKESISQNQDISIFFLDLDGLKSVNDEYGHEYGDDLIKCAAQVLSTVSIPKSVLMRYGGDEFVIVACDCGEEDRKRYELDIFTAIDDWNESDASADKPYLMKASIGSSVMKLHDVQELGALLDEADREMYRVKKMKKMSVSKNTDNV